MNDSNWILTTIIGAVVGWLLPYLVRTAVFIVRRFRRGIFDGKWCVYRVTNQDGKLKIEPSTWDIRKGFSSKFVVRETREGLETPIYKGSLFFERNFWLVRLSGVGHEEEILIRLFSPIPAENTSTWGLYLGIDFEGKPAAGPIMISREELPTASASELLQEKTRVHSRMRLLTA